MPECTPNEGKRTGGAKTVFFFLLAWSKRNKKSRLGNSVEAGWFIPCSIRFQGRFILNTLHVFLMKLDGYVWSKTCLPRPVASIFFVYSCEGSSIDLLLPRINLYWHIVKLHHCQINYRFNTYCVSITICWPSILASICSGLSCTKRMFLTAVPRFGVKLPPFTLRSLNWKMLAGTSERKPASWKGVGFFGLL